MNKFLLDQEIIVRALELAIAFCDNKQNDLFTQEMIDRLPELSKRETTKLVLLERQLKDE